MFKLITLLVLVPYAFAGTEVFAQDAVFPGKMWEFKQPEELGLDKQKLEQFAQRVKGVGCIVKDGYMVMHWGDQQSKGDWASAMKPVLSTLLMFAVEEGRLKSVDGPVRPYVQRIFDGNDLIVKDRAMTFRHLANMVSGYGLPEKPGTAWGYNDFAIGLYLKTLFDGVFQQAPNRAATHPNRLGALQFQDGSIFGSRQGYGLRTTPRDFARIGWFWLNRGNWKGVQRLPASYFDRYMQPGVSADLPRTAGGSNDYLKAYFTGGGTDQTPHGPGIYGFNWWFNAKVLGSNNRTWPDAPADTFQANGHWNRELMTIIPSLKLVVAARGNWGNFKPGDAHAGMNQNLKLLVEACRAKPEPRGDDARSRKRELYGSDHENKLPSPAPYPPSNVISGIELHWATHRRSAQGSDNFQLTWADDGHLYGAWGDGGGFGGTNARGRVSLGVARIEGSATNYRGFNVWGGNAPMNKATFPAKSWGMVCVDGTLAMWVVPEKPVGKAYRNTYEYIELARSADHGATWTKAPWKFRQSDNLTVPTFLNFGKDNAGVSRQFGAYVYSYFIRPQSPTIEDSGPNGVGLIVHKPGAVYLARVPKDKLFDGKSHYEFYRGLTADSKPMWGTVSEKLPVFENPDGTGWCLSACYAQDVKRVLLCTEHDVSQRGVIGIFDAPTPWGPWTTVEYYSRKMPFGATRPGSDLPWKHNVFFVAFPTKWFNGVRFTLNFTGAGNGRDNDSFNTVQGSFNTVDGQRAK